MCKPKFGMEKNVHTSECMQAAAALDRATRANADARRSGVTDETGVAGNVEEMSDLASTQGEELEADLEDEVVSNFVEYDIGEDVHPIPQAAGLDPTPHCHAGDIEALESEKSAMGPPARRNKHVAHKSPEAPASQSEATEPAPKRQKLLRPGPTSEKPVAVPSAEDNGFNTARQKRAMKTAVPAGANEAEIKGAHPGVAGSTKGDAPEPPLKKRRKSTNKPIYSLPFPEKRQEQMGAEATKHPKAKVHPTKTGIDAVNSNRKDSQEERALDQMHPSHAFCICCPSSSSPTKKLKRGTKNKKMKKKKKNALKAALQALLASKEALLTLALRRVRTCCGDIAITDLEKYIFARGRRRHPQPTTTWEDELYHRKLAAALPSEARRLAYQKEVQSDQRIARRKIYYPERLRQRYKVTPETEIEERRFVESTGSTSKLAPNDTELPEPSNPTQKMVETWCKEGSWAICETCHSMNTRPLEPMDTRKVREATIPSSKCKACQSGAYVPQAEDIPSQLKELDENIICALRPLDIDTGKIEIAEFGYRVHTAIISFSWASQSVDTKIAALPAKQDRKKAKKALKYLLKPDTRSQYKKFYRDHLKFLEVNGARAEETNRKLPLRWIEKKGLECCLWPHLYWTTNLCETVVRGAHTKRKNRQRPRHESNSDERSGSEVNELIQQSGRIRQNFMRKVYSPVIGYGTSYELLHFVYDLSMWTTIGTKKNIASQYNVALRLVLKGCPWAPQYWRIKHQAVIDLQRQCGNAALFRTRAPYERTFPYHRWIMDEQWKSCKRRTHASGPETLHMAHVLIQLDKGFICGDKSSTRKHKSWQNHILACTDGTGRRTVKTRVTRLEFQDGKRKLAKQKYHGRGTTHSHSLDFLQNMDAIGLERKMSASIPSKDTEPFLHGLVKDSQCDRNDSKLPVREEPSAWDPVAGKVVLHHSEADKLDNVRAYFPDTMAITKCHEDVQQSDGNGAVLHYVATYSTKFSSHSISSQSDHIKPSK